MKMEQARKWLIPLADDDNHNVELYLPEFSNANGWVQKHYVYRRMIACNVDKVSNTAVQKTILHHR
jgi:hypothetical protein